jgi:two-component system, LytTR family, sensor kinase
MQIGKYYLKEVHFRWIGILLVAYIMTFVHEQGPGEVWYVKLIVGIIYTAIYWNGSVLLFMYFRKKFPLVKQTAKRLVITFFTIIALISIVDPFLCSLLHMKSLSEAFEPGAYLMGMTFNLITVVIITSFYENAFVFDQWKNTVKVNEALKNQQIRTQFEVLQNQMSPHFLFNSLNTLTTLIAEDSKVAIDFTEKLSEVYRYILQNKEKELVTLGEELSFVKSYVFLLQMRYPENLSVKFGIENKYMSQSIPPLTLQILVENSIKHNIISKSHPLQIDIYVESGKSIVVKNNLQQKKVIQKSTKTGLDNIRKRYAYFGKHNIDVITTAQNFMVAAPLIKVTNESDPLVNLLK